MNAKILAGGVLLTVASFLAGAALSGASRDGSRGNAEIDGVEQPTDASVAESGGGASDPRDERLERLRQENERLRALLADRDDQLAAIRDGAESSETRPESEEERRARQWERLQALVDPVDEVVAQLDHDEERQLAPSDLVLDHLRAISSAQYAELAEFDANAATPEQRTALRPFLTQAIVHAPNAAAIRDGFLATALDRIYAGAYDDVFQERALHRLSLTTASGLDLQARLVAPASETVRKRLFDLAVHRLRHSGEEQLQVDGARYVARSADPRALAVLTAEFPRTSYPFDVRAHVLEGLVARAATDRDVAAILRGALDVEPHRTLRSRIEAALVAIDGERPPPR